MVRRFNASEPRKSSAAVPYRYTSSDSSLADLACMASMGCSGLAMLTRFAIWPWLGFLFALSSIFGQKSLGTNQKTGEQGGMLSGYTALMFSATAFFSIYSPILLGQAIKADGLPFGFNKGLIVVPRQAPAA
ncbi:hypothetical protein JCM10207_007204 [Rhodosporidiobolus poonsookiae]